MKKIFLLLLLAAAAVSLGLADVNVNINVGVPAVRLSPDPAMAVIPGTYIYFITESSEDILFCQGYWWRPYKGRWHRADGFNGPWVLVKTGKVPTGLLTLPKTWRKLPPGHPMVKHSLVKSNWKQWEKEKHWDKKAQKIDAGGGKKDKAKGRGKK